MKVFRVSAEERKTQVLNLYRQGFKPEEIAEQLNLSVSTIDSYIYRLKKDGLLPYAEKNNRHQFTAAERIRQIANMYNQGLSLEEITQISQLSPITVKQYIFQAKSVGLIAGYDNKKTNNHTQKESHRKQKKASTTVDDEEDKLIKEFLSSHQDIFSVNQSIKNISVEQIAAVVSTYGYQRNDVNTLIRLYAKEGLFDEAINLLYCYEASQDLSEQEKKSLDSLKHQLRLQILKQMTGKTPDYLSDGR